MQGSWVNMCVDPKGRLIVSDQYGPLYRITRRRRLGRQGPRTRKVEKLDLPLGGAHGLSWAFDSLYVMVNESVNIGDVRPRQGLHRVRSKDGGDTFEKPEFLHEVQRRRRARRPRRPARPGRQVALHRCRRRHTMVNPLDAIAGAASSGARIICCRACRTATASWPASLGRAAASTRPIPTARSGS